MDGLAVGISDECALLIEPSTLAYKMMGIRNIKFKAIVCRSSVVGSGRVNVGLDDSHATSRL